MEADVEKVKVLVELDFGGHFVEAWVLVRWWVKCWMQWFGSVLVWNCVFWFQIFGVLQESWELWEWVVTRIVMVTSSYGNEQKKATFNSKQLHSKT